MSLPLPANHVPLWTAHASYTKLRCYARCNRPRRSVAKRSYPSPKVRGSGQECQAATAQERLRGATLRPGLGRWPRGATPRPRLGRRPRVVTPHPSLGGGREEQPPSKEQRLCGAQEGREELLHIQGQEGQPVRRYPSSKVRSSSCTLLEQP